MGMKRRRAIMIKVNWYYRRFSRYTYQLRRWTSKVWRINFRLRRNVTAYILRVRRRIIYLRNRIRIFQRNISSSGIRGFNRRWYNIQVRNSNRSLSLYNALLRKLIARRRAIRLARLAWLRRQRELARLRRMKRLTGYYLRRWAICRRAIRIANY